MVSAEIALASKNPLMEAEFQFYSEDAPLKVYDSLIPHLRKRKGEEIYFIKVN